MKKQLIKAVCLKTYLDESDIEDCCDGKIELSAIRMYHKGRTYLVAKGYDRNYYKELD